MSQRGIRFGGRVTSHAVPLSRSMSVEPGRQEMRHAGGRATDTGEQGSERGWNALST